jgi:hypothetical protein
MDRWMDDQNKHSYFSHSIYFSRVIAPTITLSFRASCVAQVPSPQPQRLFLCLCQVPRGQGTDTLVLPPWAGSSAVPVPRGVPRNVLSAPHRRSLSCMVDPTSLSPVAALVAPARPPTSAADTPVVTVEEPTIPPEKMALSPRGDFSGWPAGDTAHQDGLASGIHERRGS